MILGFTWVSSHKVLNLEWYTIMLLTFLLHMLVGKSSLWHLFQYNKISRFPGWSQKVGYDMYYKIGQELEENVWILFQSRASWTSYYSKTPSKIVEFHMYPRCLKMSNVANRAEGPQVSSCVKDHSMRSTASFHSKVNQFSYTSAEYRLRRGYNGFCFIRIMTLEVRNALQTAKSTNPWEQQQIMASADSNSVGPIPALSSLK
jgi:hypothetical protein